MRAIRRTLPLVLVLAGLALLVHGFRSHVVPIYEVEEIEISQELPRDLPPGLGGPGPFGGPGGFGGPSPFIEPPAFRPKLKEKVLVPKTASEPALIRDVTVGGVVRLASGELKRTYSGKAPSLCPS